MYEKTRKNENKKKNIIQIFVNSLQILPVWQILFLILFVSFEIYKLLLCVQRLAPQISSWLFSEPCTRTAIVFVRLKTAELTY